MPVELLRFALRRSYPEPRMFRVPERLKPSYDVVIIGAGGHGLAAAHYLASAHGITDVAVLDKSYLGGGNTGRNTTIVRSNYLTPEGVAFYDASVKLFEELALEVDLNLFYRARGHFTLAHSDASVRTMRWRAEVNKHLGVDSELVDADFVARACPGIDLSCGGHAPILGALWHPPGAIVRHDGVAWGYAKMADRRGVEIHQHTEVTGIDVAGGRVRGVHTTRGYVATACSTDTGAACGTYFLTGVVETKRTFVPTGTLACPGSPGFAGDDVDGVAETCPEIDACPDDPLKMSPGACGCGIADTDGDTDGTPDCLDGCSDDPLKTEAGLCGCGVSDADSDNDDIADCDDFCPDVPGEGVPAPPQFDCNNAAELGGEPLLVGLGDFCGNPAACPAESWGGTRGTVFADACEGFASCGPFEFFGLGQICDGFADCSNGLDEQGCVEGVGLVCE